MDIEQIKIKLKEAGLNQRISQLKMVQETFQALSRQQIICLEAPTGTGKTIAYGIAGFFAKTSRQIIISTATIALQEQLQNKDLPLLAKILNIPIQSAQAKGRRRYVCHARLYDENVQTDMFSNSSYRQKMQSLLEDHSWNGDRDELQIFISDQEWLQVSTDTTGCTGRNCSYFQECAFYQARQKWLQCDFVITNHSLLLSDLKLGGGVLLPSPENSIYIIDECHHLPDKALDYFSRAAEMMKSVDWINHLTLAIGKGVNNGLISESRQQVFQESSHRVVQSLHAAHLFLQQNSHLFVTETMNPSEKTWRYTQQQTTPLEELSQSIRLSSQQLLTESQQLLIELDEKLKLAANDNSQQQTLTKFIAQIGFYHHQIENLYSTWALFCETQTPQEPPIARWFVEKENHYTCHAAPINISKRLKSLLWDVVTNGALLCSATIRAVGEFNDYRRKTGLQNHPQLVELALDTCFDYSQSILFVPSMQHAPQGSEQTSHRQEALQLLPQLILPRSGTLVLFTSKSAMETTFAGLSPELQADILMQGTLPKSLLLNRHQENISNRQRSILFGLTSFGEGLDLADTLCQHVIIHKLPFAVPTTPVELTRNEWLEKNKLNPFSLSTLPHTSLRLAQYVGRLIRQESDIGIVTILDKRLYTKPYGNELLKNLPPFQRLLNSSLQTLKIQPTTQHLW